MNVISICCIWHFCYSKLSQLSAGHRRGYIRGRYSHSACTPYSGQLYDLQSEEALADEVERGEVGDGRGGGEGGGRGVEVEGHPEEGHVLQRRINSVWFIGDSLFMACTGPEINVCKTYRARLKGAS